VSEGTRDILIESAYFDPISIRKTSKKTGIQTDASYRFERGADIAFLPKAGLMVASLLTQMGGKAAKAMVDVFPKPKKNKKTVILRQHRIADLLGVNVEADFVEKILARLDFQPEKQQQGIWKVRVPSFRVDVEREADLIEEIARYFGYDKIPSTIPPLVEFEPPPDPKKRQIQKLRHMFFIYGFDEVVNFSFADPEKESPLKTGMKAIEIRNPISTKASHLRTTLLGGLLENVSWNRNRGMDGVHIFEVGNVYFWEDHSCKEKLGLALVTTGFLGKDNWHEQRKPTDFFHLKGACEAVLSHLRYVPVIYEPEDLSHFESGSSLSLLVKGEKVGHLGRLPKAILDDYSLKEPVWAAELDLVSLFQKQPQPFLYTPVVKYPQVVRDISFIADEDVSYQEIKQAIEDLSLPHLEQFEPYDRFSGKNISKGKVSLSFRFLFRHPQRTLLAEEVEISREKVIKVLSNKFGFQLREGGEIDK
ncbi:MAG: phenylalanine--tRNA ligase subunit beta, partial [Candidatus Aminicenantes bacterium]|nr:phenylalanine--tRNA ligase subunit beta [Candidatus Aminicenantes bacterium]